jgi:hypothetical protein
MEKPLYVIEDLKAGCTQHPFHMPTDRDAIQQFRELVNDPKTTLNKFPEDFVLYRVGSWDSRDKKFIDENLKSLISASALLEKEN